MKSLAALSLIPWKGVLILFKRPRLFKLSEKQRYRFQRLETSSLLEDLRRLFIWSIVSKCTFIGAWRICFTRSAAPTIPSPIVGTVIWDWDPFWVRFWSHIALVHQPWKRSVNRMLHTHGWTTTSFVLVDWNKILVECEHIWTKKTKGIPQFTYSLLKDRENEVVGCSNFVNLCWKQLKYLGSLIQTPRNWIHWPWTEFAAEKVHHGSDWLCLTNTSF